MSLVHHPLTTKINESAKGRAWLVCTMHSRHSPSRSPAFQTEGKGDLRQAKHNNVISEYFFPIPLSQVNINSVHCININNKKKADFMGTLISIPC